MECNTCQICTESQVQIAIPKVKLKNFGISNQCSKYWESLCPMVSVHSNAPHLAIFWNRMGTKPAAFSFLNFFYLMFCLTWWPFKSSHLFRDTKADSVLSPFLNYILVNTDSQVPPRCVDLNSLRCVPKMCASWVGCYLCFWLF